MLNQFDVSLPKLRQIGFFLFVQFPFHLCRTAHHERVRRNLCARRDQRTGGDERAFADARAVKNYRADAD